MPICFGLLKMTAEDIYNATPWEINKRIQGLSDRQRYNRLILAQLVTLPVYNSGFNAPKGGAKLEDVLPKEDFEIDVTKNEIDKWRNLIEEEKEKRKLLKEARNHG